ncbi:MAG: hypothetical protein JWM59_3144 [Verrucomicrobiales bacterium]|nr:hypothetical protein [Verrucomicrobiales bacterium]
MRFRLLLLPLLLLPVFRLSAQTPVDFDGFEDNDDTGWVHMDPIGTVMGSSFASIKAESGAYHISCPPSPDPGSIGPARAGAYRPDRVLTDFVIVVDLAAWDQSLDQALGILARIQPDPGPGALSGYSVNYQTRDHDIEINRLDNEQPVSLVRLPLELRAGEPCRLVFTGTGASLTASVFSHQNPLLPLVTLSAEDDTYASGDSGIFIFQADTPAAGAADGTFDSFSASAPSVPALSISSGTGGKTPVQLEWPRSASHWHLQRSSDLETWADVTEGGLENDQVIQWNPPADAPAKGYYRLQEGWAKPR